MEKRPAKPSAPARRNRWGAFRHSPNELQQGDARNAHRPVRTLRTAGTHRGREADDGNALWILCVVRYYRARNDGWIPMAVCRFGERSDVHVFYSTEGHIECCGCILSCRASFRASNEIEMIVHLKEHRSAGHMVPGEAVAELRAELKP